jgi:hypothetical protein
MHSSSSSSSRSQLATRHSFFQALYPDLVREILFFAPNPPEELSIISQNAKKAIASPAYWQRLLQRDFGLSWEFIKKHMRFDSARIVYQRLLFLKTNSSIEYDQFYKKMIMDSCIYFPPLFATGPSFDAIPTERLLVYLDESLRWRNPRLAKHILSHLFFVVSKTKALDVPLTIFVDQKTIEIAASDSELLEQMLPYAKQLNDSRYAESIQLILDSRTISPSDQAAIDYLHSAIKNKQYALANKFLKKGIVPTKETLTLTFHHSDPYSFPDYPYWRFFFKLLDLVPQHSQLSESSYPDQRDSLQFKAFLQLFINCLRAKADPKLIERVYQSARLLPRIFDQEALKKIHSCLLERVATHDMVSSSNTLAEAVSKNQVAVVRYFIEDCHAKPDASMVRDADNKCYADLAIYLLSQCLDNFPEEFLLPKKLLPMMRRMSQPNDDVNKLLDWLIDSQGKNCPFQATCEDLIDDIDANVNPRMLVWLAAKLKIEISIPLLVETAKTFAHRHRSCHGRYGDYSEIIATQCRQAWEDICIESFKYWHKDHADIQVDEATGSMTITKSASSFLQYRR